jgi:hypothetical protein
MEATYSSKTSVDFQLTTRRYIPEDSRVHNHRCGNFKSYVFFSFSFGLFNDVNSSGYIVTNGGMWDEWIGKDLEGSGRGLIEGPLRYLRTEIEENHEKSFSG